MYFFFDKVVPPTLHGCKHVENSVVIKLRAPGGQNYMFFKQVEALLPFTMQYELETVNSFWSIEW